MRPPKDFFRPLAVGAPEPLREIPVRPSRMIHFFPPSVDKMVAKVPDIIPTVDVLLANLEDGVPATDKDAARAGMVRVAQDNDFGETQFWTRINSLDSPWCLDDLTGAVLEAGEALDVIMVPRSRARRTSTTSTGCWRSWRPRQVSTPRCRSTRSWRPPAAWPTSRRSAARRRACRACRSARPTWPPTGG